MAYGAPDIPACSLAESNFGSQVSSGPLQEDLGRFFFWEEKEKKNGRRKSQILQVRRRLAIRNEKEEHILCFDT